MTTQADYILSLNAVLSIVLLFMFIEYLIVILIQGSKSVKAGTKVKEDQLPGRPLPNPTESDKQSDERWRKIVGNHAETMAFAFTVFLISVYVCGYSGNHSARLALLILIIIYGFLRVIWTFAYIFAWQPFRTIFWLLSMMCVFGGGFVGIVTAFTGVEQGQLDNN